MCSSDLPIYLITSTVGHHFALEAADCRLSDASLNKGVKEKRAAITVSVSAVLVAPEWGQTGPSNELGKSLSLKLSDPGQQMRRARPEGSFRVP